MIRSTRLIHICILSIMWPTTSIADHSPAAGRCRMAFPSLRSTLRKTTGISRIWTAHCSCSVDNVSSFGPLYVGVSAESFNNSAKSLSLLRNMGIIYLFICARSTHGKDGQSYKRGPCTMNRHPVSADQPYAGELLAWQADLRSCALPRPKASRCRRTVSDRRNVHGYVYQTAACPRVPGHSLRTSSRKLPERHSEPTSPALPDSSVHQRRHRRSIEFSQPRHDEPSCVRRYHRVLNWRNQTPRTVPAFHPAPL